MMNFCPNCGNKLNKGMHVCPNCGIRLDADSEQAQSAAMNNAVQLNNIPSGAQRAAFDDWSSGTIFVNPDAEQQGSYAAQGQSQNVGAYSQSFGQNGMPGMYGADAAQQLAEDAWNDGTVFADQGAYAGYPVHDVQQPENRKPIHTPPAPMQANPYQEQRIQTPYTAPMPKSEKQRMAKAPKREKAKIDGGSLRDTIIRIVALVIVVVCVAVGVITGGF